MTRLFSDIYILQHCIGDVPFGSLYSARRNFDGKTFCARELEYTDSCTSHYRMLRLDIDLITSFKHKRLAHVYEVIHEQESSLYYIVQEDGTTKHLADMVQSAKSGSPPSEDLVWCYIAQLAEVLAAMHSTSYRLDEAGSPPRILVHGSLVTDIVHTDPSDLRLIKLKTLGVGREVLVGWNPMNTKGSKSYIAPELYTCLSSGTYVQPQLECLFTPGCDMWALGAFAYELCTGSPLVRKKTKDYIGALGELVRPIPLPGYSDDLVALVDGLLNLNPEKRLAAKDVLALPAVQSALETLT